VATYAETGARCKKIGGGFSAGITLSGGRRLHQLRMEPSDLSRTHFGANAFQRMPLTTSHLAGGYTTVLAVCGRFGRFAIENLSPGFHQVLPLTLLCVVMRIAAPATLCPLIRKVLRSSFLSIFRTFWYMQRNILSQSLTLAQYDAFSSSLDDMCSRAAALLSNRGTHPSKLYDYF
jgi:hypothetical protein